MCISGQKSSVEGDFKVARKMLGNQRWKDTRRGEAKNDCRDALEAEGQTAALVQDEVMTGRLLCLETAEEFPSNGSLSSVKCKERSSVESYDWVLEENQQALW